MSDSWNLMIYQNPEGKSPFLDWFYIELNQEQQNLILSAFEEFVIPYGPELLQTKWMSKILGELYQLRIRRYGNYPEKRVLLRVYLHFYSQNQGIVLSGYDKRKDSSRERQEFEINRAMDLLAQWRSFS